MNRKVFILSDGTVSKNYPYPFFDRDHLVEYAKEVASRLNFTKKIKDKELIEHLFVNDEDVKLYRELMRKIWSFTTDIYVVEEKIICYNCGSYDKPLIETSYSYKNSDTHYILSEIRCKDCCKDFHRIFDDSINLVEEKELE